MYSLVSNVEMCMLLLLLLLLLLCGCGIGQHDLSGLVAQDHVSLLLVSIYVYSWLNFSLSVRLCALCVVRRLLFVFVKFCVFLLILLVRVPIAMLWLSSVFTDT